MSFACGTSITDIALLEIKLCPAKQSVPASQLTEECDPFNCNSSVLMNETLKTMCHAFVKSVKDNRDHPLNARLPTRKDGIRYSNRTSDKSSYLPDAERKSAILVNKEYLC